VERQKSLEVNGKNKLEYLTYFLFYAVFDLTVFHPINSTINNNNYYLALCLFYMSRPLQSHHQGGIYEGIKSTANINMCMYRVKTKYCQYFQLKLL